MNDKEKEALEEIKKWAEDKPCCLSNAPGYAQGYRAGWLHAKEVVRYILREKRV